MTLAKYREARDEALVQYDDMLPKPKYSKVSKVRQHAACFRAMCDKNIARARGIIPRVLARQKKC